jgi:hypothetical protein
MSCRECIHFKPPPGKHRWEEDLTDGFCRRYPKPLATSPRYHCGEFTTNDGGAVERFMDQRDEYLAEYRNERTKRLESERKLKALRQKIRANKAPTNA